MNQKDIPRFVLVFILYILRHFKKFCRKLSSAQWVALALLVVGAADVQWSSSGDASHSNAWKSTQKPFIGLCAVATMCVTSAIAGFHHFQVIHKKSLFDDKVSFSFDFSLKQLYVRTYEISLAFSNLKTELYC